MNTSINDIVLRPRFKIEIPRSNTSVLEDFEKSKTTQTDIIVNRLDDHVFIKQPKYIEHFWSPQLHLEINKIDANRCVLQGLIGPSPTMWTLFMFFHFIIASLFIAFGVWAYSNWTLKTDYIFQISLMLLMVIIWVALYFGGRIGRASSKAEMQTLQDFMLEILNEPNTNILKIKT
ncbi:GTP-binding protein [Algibacter pacificus]|uniref:GTP-binding protein n=1 Tax=Algibacter pacificus TaxID=2599389 RepID=UPI0011CB5410|nr:GTP-binding protein [Algibacter pacificus]